MTTRLLLVDDHPSVRKGLRHCLESIGQFCVIGEADNTEQALQIAGEHVPDLAVVDIGLRGRDGIELTCSLCSVFPQVAVLILTMHESHEYVLRAIRAGARGYVLKDAPMQQIIAAIMAITAGGMYYSNAVMDDITRGAVNPQLSQREMEILNLIVKGYSNKETANFLSLSVRTIETHRESIRRKLGADSTVDLVRYALKIGLIRM